MRVAGFIANRIAFNQQRSFSRFIIRLSIVATVISVAVMIVTMAFANGFQQEVGQKVFSFSGHIRIEEKQPYKVLFAEETPIDGDDSLVNAIRRNPEVESIDGFGTKYSLLKSKNEVDGVLLKGFDSSYSFSHLKRFIVEGRPIDFRRATYSREIMLSAYTAKQLNVHANDSLYVYFFKTEGIRTDKLLISGVYKTGIEDFDKWFAIGDLRLVRRLNAWQPGAVGGYEIFLKDYNRIDTVSDQLRLMDNFPATWDTESVKDIIPNIFDWLKMQDTTRYLLIAFMVVVAIINLISCLMILVLERVKMIGVLKALGARDWTVQMIFLRHSAIITCTGIVIGMAVGLGILYLQKATGFIKLQEEAYYLSRAAVKINWMEVGAVCLSTLIVSILVLMIPSILVRKIRPVKAIRFN